LPRAVRTERPPATTRSTVSIIPTAADSIARGKSVKDPSMNVPTAESRNSPDQYADLHPARSVLRVRIRPVTGCDGRPRIMPHHIG